MKQGLVGLLALGVLIFSAVYFTVTIKDLSSVRQVSQAVSSGSFNNKKSSTKTGLELYTEIQSLNTQISKAISNTQQSSAPTLSENKAIKITQIVPVKIETETLPTPEQDAQGSTLEIVENLIAQRENLLNQVAQTAPDLFLVSNVPQDVVKKLSNLGLTLEKPVTLSGKLEVAHYDDPDSEDNDYFQYFINSGGERITFYPTRDISVLSGTPISVTGARLGNTFVASVDDVHLTSTASTPSGPFGPRNPPPPTPPSTGEHRMLVILVNFLDSATPYITPSDLQNRIFNGPFQNFMTEQSYSNIHFSGDVVGWYTLPRNNTSAWPDWPNGSNELSALLTAHNINVNNYDHIVFAIDGMSGGFGTLGHFDINGVQYPVSMVRLGIGPPSLGSGTIPANTLPIFDKNLAHEIGHNLGVLHANVLDCGNQVLREDCTHVEAGNLFDTMGLGTYSYHFNAFYKELLGWITPQEILTITQNGRYTINPIESLAGSSNANVKRFAKIERVNSTSFPYYVELRKAIGFDTKINAANTTASQNGLFVNRIVHDSNPNWTSLYSPELLDMQPFWIPPVPDMAAVTLNVGSLFTDPATGITIGPVISSDNSSITFDVNTGLVPCIHTNPILIISASTMPIVAGTNGVIQAGFGNADPVSCAQSMFNITVTTPALAGIELSDTGNTTQNNTQPINLNTSGNTGGPTTNSSITNSLQLANIMHWPSSINPTQDVAIVPTGSTLPTRGKTVTFTVPDGTQNGVYPIVVTAINKTTGLRTVRTANITVTH